MFVGEVSLVLFEPAEFVLTKLWSLERLCVHFYLAGAPSKKQPRQLAV